MKESAARKRILDVASRLFYEQGYNSTGINQIIDEADIARGSLYNHFHSKRELLSAYIKNAEYQWFEELDKFLKPIKDPRNKILGLFDFRIERQERSNFGGCKFSKIGAEVSREDIHAFELIGHQKKRIEAYILALIEHVELKHHESLSREMLSETIHLLLEGAMVSVSIFKNTEALKKARKIADSIL